MASKQSQWAQKQAVKKEAIAQHFAEAAGERHTLVVRRGGNARTREVVVDGQIRLDWRSNGESVPVMLPAGHHVLACMVIGSEGQTYGFDVISPKEQFLGAGTLTALGAETFDRDVVIP